MQPATVSTQQKTQRLNVSVNIAMMPSIYWKLFHCYNHCRDVHGDHCEMTQDSSWFTNLFKEVCSCHYCSYYLCCLRFQLRKDQERSWQPRQVHFRRRECGGKVQVCCSAINLKTSRPDFDKNWEALRERISQQQHHSQSSVALGLFILVQVSFMSNSRDVICIGFCFNSIFSTSLL